MASMRTDDQPTPMRTRAPRSTSSRIVRFAVALLFVGGCWNAPPPVRVLCFGDSITAWYKPTDWPTLLGKARPDLEVVNAGVPGRTTVDGLAQFDEAFRQAEQKGRVSDVVVLLGINDLHLLGSTPQETAGRLRELAQRIRQAGAREWLLTLTPANKIPLRRELPARRFSREVGTWLHKLNESEPRYTILDLWERFEGPLDWSKCSRDGLHPDNEACRAEIAKLVAGELPGTGTIAGSSIAGSSSPGSTGPGSAAAGANKVD